MPESAESRESTEPRRKAPAPKSSVELPGHGLAEEAETLSKEIALLRRAAEKISILNPIRGAFQYRRCLTLRKEMADRFSLVLGRALGALRTPVSGGALEFFQTWSLGQSLAAVFILQLSWQWFTGTLDRKAAFLVASVSIYLSVIALTATLVLGILSLQPEPVTPVATPEIIMDHASK
jgi:hypothetical protein